MCGKFNSFCNFTSSKWNRHMLRIKEINFRMRLNMVMSFIFQSWPRSNLEPLDPSSLSTHILWNLPATLKSKGSAFSKFAYTIGLPHKEEEIKLVLEICPMKDPFGPTSCMGLFSRDIWFFSFEPPSYTLTIDFIDLETTLILVKAWMSTCTNLVNNSTSWKHQVNHFLFWI